MEFYHLFYVKLAPSGLWPSGSSSARLWERLYITGPLALSRAASPAAPRSRGQSVLVAPLQRSTQLAQSIFCRARYRRMLDMAEGVIQVK